MRSSGILMPVFSLPSRYGIGTLGAEAYRFVDFLAASGQTWWQILPVGPTGFGDSPYQSFSTFAGNPFFVDLDLLCGDGLLESAEPEAVNWGDDPARVDYAALHENRLRLLFRAAKRCREREEASVRAFEERNDWLPDYALFMALKKHFHSVAWMEWPDEDIRLRRPAAMERYRTELAEDIRLFTGVQYLFFRQWEALRTYAHEKGVGIIGDLPLYVAADSADVWASPDVFRLDERNMPVEVAGVPPDYFSADGQLWGNPVYDWEAMKENGYDWWICRVTGASRLYDVLRLDHFRGLESYWVVPRGETTARNGRWVKGPGMDFLRELIRKTPQVRYIAEDLGFLTDEVHALRRDAGFPGMRVLQFSFDSHGSGDSLPYTFAPHSVCYTGTHDNTTILGWREEADAGDVALAGRYFGLNAEEGFHWGMLRGGMSCASELFIAPMQDYLGLGADARINTPGCMGGNWQWRMQPECLTDALAARIADMTALYGRRASFRPMPT